MSLQEIKAAIAKLPPAELDALLEWIKERQRAKQQADAEQSPSIHQLPEKLRQPDAMIAFIRSSNKDSFSPVAICLCAAILLIVLHKGSFWPLAIGLAATAVIYFPMGLSFYRRDKKATEKAIRNYETWRSEHNPSGESKP